MKPTYYRFNCTLNSKLYDVVCDGVDVFLIDGRQVGNVVSFLVDLEYYIDCWRVLKEEDAIGWKPGAANKLLKQQGG